MKRWRDWRPWKVVEKHDRLPVGLSFCGDVGGLHSWALKLVFPAFIWHRRHVYQISTDNFAEGWHVLWLLVGVYGAYQFFDLRFAYGWSLKGQR